MMISASTSAARPMASCVRAERNRPYKIINQRMPRGWWRHPPSTSRDHDVPSLAGTARGNTIVLKPRHHPRSTLAWRTVRPDFPAGFVM